MHQFKRTLISKILSCCTLAFFLSSSIMPLPAAQAQTILGLPQPGTMVMLSPAFQPAIIKGINLNPNNPLQFDFIVDRGESGLYGESFNEESQKLVKYFLASLTVPENDMWVNLSPVEKDRIVPDNFGQTEMGRDLLAQDYILKQLTSTLMYPENELGKKFWDEIYKQAKERFNSTEIPTDTFNKVWIVPEKAVVYEHDKGAFILETHLKVLMEQDYLGKKIEDGRGKIEDTINPSSPVNLQSSLIKKIIIPAIEREVNEGKNFANLRQVYNSMILATWYKQNLKKSILGQVYNNQNKTAGVDIEDKQVNQKIYDQYLAAFKKGVFDYMKEDYDAATQQVIPRKYFSGGAAMAAVVVLVPDQVVDYITVDRQKVDAAMKGTLEPTLLSMGLNGIGFDATVVLEYKNAEQSQASSADAAMLSNFNFDPTLKVTIENILQNAGETNQGLATIKTRDGLEFTQKSQARTYLVDRLDELFTAQTDEDEKHLVQQVFIDGIEHTMDLQEGKYTVRASSLDSNFNLLTGTANGTSFEIYEQGAKSGDLKVVASVRILWGTRLRIVVTDGKKTVDYQLEEDNTLSQLKVMKMKSGKTFALSGFSKDRPIGMQAYEEEVVPNLSGIKNRNTESTTADGYQILSKNGLLTSWMTWGEAIGWAQAFEGAGGKAMVMTSEGMRNISDLPVTKRKVASKELMYVYAGSKEQVDQVAVFLNAREEEFAENARTRNSLPDISLEETKYEETLGGYIENSVFIPKEADVDGPTATDLKQRSAVLANAVVEAYLRPTVLPATDDGYADPEQKKLVDDLAAILPDAIITLPDGQRALTSMRDYLRRYKSIPGQDKITNPSGDQQHPLDFAFNTILNYVIRPFVDGIISEEDKKIVFGIGERNADTYRLVTFTDPVDGSSQIDDAGAFGSIIGIGFLKPGETLEKGDFDPRTRSLFGFDLGYATGTSIGMFNRATKEGKKEVVQFGLTEDGDEIVFRKEATFENFLDMEIQHLQWQGLIPQVNVGKPLESALHLALGGSFADSAPEYTAFMRGLIARYGMVPHYTGALQIDEKRIIIVSKLKTTAAGRGYFYPSQFTIEGNAGEAKKIKRGQKLRLFFEGYFYAMERWQQGAEVLDGDTVAPLLNTRAKGSEPSKTKASIMSASSWMTKMYMTWNEFYLKQNGEPKAVMVTSEEAKTILEKGSVWSLKEIEAKSKEQFKDADVKNLVILYFYQSEDGNWRVLTDNDIRRQFEDFLTKYETETEKLVQSIAGYSQERNGDVIGNLTVSPQSVIEVRKALLTYDSIDKGVNYFPRILEMSSENAYHQLFAPQVVGLATTHDGDAATLADQSVESWEDGLVNPKADEYGGIDFNPQKMNLEKQGNGLKVDFHLDPDMINDLKIDGFVPVIINVTPITNLPLMLGLRIPKKVEDFEAARL